MRILIVDDETNIQKTTSVALKTMGHTVVSAFSGSQALRKIEEDRVDAIFLDLRLGEENGLEVFDKIRDSGCEAPVVMFTAYASIETAVEATRKGVFDYIPKPFVPDQIRQTLQRLQSSRSLQNRVKDLESQLGDDQATLKFESNEAKMEELFEIAERSASADASILILGPSGTGKSVLARHIHEVSARASEPFVVVHCPSLSKELLESELFGHVKGSFTGAVKDTWGKVEAADGGTLFLDEIGELPLEIQAKLLRFLQERCYERIGETKTRQADVRILAATNKDLTQEVTDGEFREDLFYRLNVITLEMPGLIERPGDILELANRFTEHFARKMGKPAMTLSKGAVSAIRSYEWPGNLRELKNVIERAVILSQNQEIEVEDLPVRVRGESGNTPDAMVRPGASVTLQELEDQHIRYILETSDSIESAATTLGIDTATLYRKRKRLGLL